MQMFYHVETVVSVEKTCILRYINQKVTATSEPDVHNGKNWWQEKETSVEAGIAKRNCWETGGV